jgi:hypothetical protein
MTTLLTKERKASWSATFGTGAQIEDKMELILFAGIIYLAFVL